MKPIRNYENEYYITDEGRVYRKGGPLPLSPSVNPQNGYLYVSLWKNGVGKTFSVHRLVGTHYLPNPDNLPVLNHKNSNRADPRVTNLEWCTQSDNIQHGYAYGSMSQVHKRNFTQYELDLLLNSFLSGVTITSLAKATSCGLSRLSINLRNLAIKQGRLPQYEDELYRQKCIRNKAVNAAKQQKIGMLSLDGTLVRTFPSITAAAKFLGKKSTGTISNYLKGRQSSAYGHLWKLM